MNEYQKPKIPLPIDDKLAEIKSAVLNSTRVILHATPGAGKTTRVPPYLASAMKGKTLVLQPRRIAALGAAKRIAQEMNWSLGQEVGYQVRFDQRSTEATKVLFLTEALLIRKMTDDPDLSDVSLVILDEFHERHLHSDLALSALVELQELSRPDMRVLVMSATLDLKKLQEFMPSAPLIEVQTPRYPIEIKKEGKPLSLRIGPDWTERMRNLVIEAADQTREGDVLVFLPGRREIDNLRSALKMSPQLTNFQIESLFGQMNLEDQAKILSPSEGRRIILATNVAESSITVPGVRTVVDSGLARQNRLHHQTGFQSLDLIRISKASARQRAGRAGREGPGLVYQAWSALDDQALAEFDVPEIHRTDLTETLLTLAQLGVQKFETFSWFESPQADQLASAVLELRELGLLDPENRITPLGQACQKFPLPPAWALLLILSSVYKFESEALRWIAAFQVANQRRMPPTSGSMGTENDLALLCESIESSGPIDLKRLWQKSQDQLRILLKKLDVQRKHFPEELQIESQSPLQSMSFVFARCFPSQICRRRAEGENRGLMANGRGVLLAPDSCVKKSEFFVALDLSESESSQESRVRLAVGLDPSWVESTLKKESEPRRQLVWMSETKKPVVQIQKFWRGLSLDGGRFEKPTAQELQDFWSLRLSRDRSELRRLNPDFDQWMLRWEFAKKNLNLDFEITDQVLEDVLSNCLGHCQSEDDIAKAKIIQGLSGLLPREIGKKLSSECPTEWVLPSGSIIPLTYSLEQGVSAEVRLQEVFGIKETPRFAGQPLTLVLLAPNNRPAQVTKDLKSFWAGSYSDVRKELRARYPKHSWPENPADADPQTKGILRRKQ